LGGRTAATVGTMFRHRTTPGKSYRATAPGQPREIVLCTTGEMQVLEPYLRLSEEIPGWIRGEQAKALAYASFVLPGVPTIVQIGSFFGAAAILLAGARRAKGSGKVFCVDPFDCSGDEFS